MAGSSTRSSGSPSTRQVPARHRLNRALHDITLTRWRADLRTHAYIARRRAAGKSDTEIHRALKRYVARELFRVLEATPAA